MIVQRSYRTYQEGHRRHRSEVRQVPFWQLQEGQAVEFEVEETPQGPKARRVRVIAATHTTPLRPNE